MSYFHGYGNDRKDGDSVLWWIVTKLYHVSKIELILRSTGIQNIIWKMSLPARNCRKPLTKLSSTNTVYKCYKFCGNCVSEDFSLQRNRREWTGEGFKFLADTKPFSRWCDVTIDGCVIWKTSKLTHPVKISDNAHATSYYSSAYIFDDDFGLRMTSP